MFVAINECLFTDIISTEAATSTTKAYAEVFLSPRPLFEHTAVSTTQITLLTLDVLIIFTVSALIFKPCWLN